MVPILMPTLVLVAVVNFIAAAHDIASVARRVGQLGPITCRHVVHLEADHPIHHVPELVVTRRSLARFADT
jgi:hypothetical protein